MQVIVVVMFVSIGMVPMVKWMQNTLALLVGIAMLAVHGVYH